MDPRLSPWPTPLSTPAIATDQPSGPLRQCRPGRLTTAWHALTITMWFGVFVAYLAVWKASEEIGLATWWLGPRSDPAPLLLRLFPFLIIAIFGILASYNVRRLPVIGLVGAVAMAGIAIPDLSRSTGLAVVEFTIAGAVAIVSVVSLTGMHRAPREQHDR